MLFLLAKPSFAQQSIRLNNGWEFLRQDLGSIWEAVRPITKDGPETVPQWQSVTLPHCFNARDAYDPDLNYYQGPGWYRTQIEVKNPYTNGRTLLHFEGAGQKTEVYVYTTKVASHNGGYDEWTVDLTEAIENFKKTQAYTQQFKGKIPVEIRCDNSRDVESIPSRLSDFNVYGGIYRYLNLVYTPAVSVEDIFAAANIKDKTGTIDIKARFYNPQQNQAPLCTITLYNPAGKLVRQLKNIAPSANENQALATIKLNNPLLWSPQHPVLYTVKLNYTINNQPYTKTEKVGFRSFEFADKGPFYLNGQRLLLRGTHRHEDHAGVAAAMTEDMIRQEMQLIKNMGANFIRLGHYQQSRIVLNLCDSLGLLVWEEEPWCRGGLGGETYQAQAQQMLTHMIEQHYNHPSIILWGLGNENDWEGDFPEFDKEKIRTFMKSQNDLAHRLDPSRKTTIRRCDFCKDIPDVYSPSIWAGWYKGVYTQYKKFTKDEIPKVNHFFHAEWGGDSHAGRFDEADDVNPPGTIIAHGKAYPADTLLKGKTKITAAKDGNWTESYICNLFDWHLKEQETMPSLTGSAFWTFKDFSTPLRPDNPIPYMNQKGVVQSDLTTKEAYYVVQSYWSEKPMAHIFGNNWPVRWGDEGELKMIKVYANCEQAELLVNGKSYGTKMRNSQDYPAAGLRWMVPLKEGENHLKVIAHRGQSVVIDTLTQYYQTKKWNKPAQLQLKAISTAQGISTIEVKLVDAKQTPCLNAANWIYFSISGDGILMDDLGTSHGSRKIQAANGRALIQVKNNGGKSVVGVQSPGLPTAFVEL
ncbi:glycoside hydrolase family 2 TIM barrel-domain containing protein [Mucilaginibacter koreensis]